MGKTTDIASLISRMPSRKDGLYPNELVMLLKSENIQANYRPGRSISSLESMTQKGKPVIVQISGADNFSHFVVLDGITTRNGQRVAAIRDPHGIQYFSPIDSFKKSFTGHTVYVK